MPTPNMMRLPVSESDTEFEDLCTDILTLAFNIKFQRYGRKGQKQHGIDIYAKTDSNDLIVAQCKNYFDPKSVQVLCKQIQSDIKEAKVKFEINKFIVITSLRRDKNIQDFINSINESFQITALFWDDIENIICRSNELLIAYYPTLINTDKLPMKVSNDIITALNILIYGAKEIKKLVNYKVATNYNLDVQIYNLCLDMYNRKQGLFMIKNKWHLHLLEIDSKLINNIDIIIENHPEFYDENESGTGAHLISTVSNYIIYFSKDVNYSRHKKLCKNIIKTIENSIS